MQAQPFLICLRVPGQLFAPVSSLHIIDNSRLSGPTSLWLTGGSQFRSLAHPALVNRTSLCLLRNAFGCLSACPRAAYPGYVPLLVPP